MPQKFLNEEAKMSENNSFCKLGQRTNWRTVCSWAMITHTLNLNVYYVSFLEEPASIVGRMTKSGETSYRWNWVYEISNWTRQRALGFETRGVRLRKTIWRYTRFFSINTQAKGRYKNTASGSLLCRAKVLGRRSIAFLRCRFRCCEVQSQNILGLPAGFIIILIPRGTIPNSGNLSSELGRLFSLVQLK